MNAEFQLNGKVITADRLILRPFREDDLEDFFEYASVDGVGELAGWQHHENREESLKILHMFMEEDKVFALCDRSTGKLIGSLGVECYGGEAELTEFDGLKGRELGYVLNKDYWGKGLMPEAVTAVIRYLFDEVDLDFLTCCYYDFNSQSKRVQEKCGFRPYRKLELNTRIGGKEHGVMNLLLNPRKDLHLQFSHPDTLIWED